MKSNKAFYYFRLILQMGLGEGWLNWTHLTDRKIAVRIVGKTEEMLVQGFFFLPVLTAPVPWTCGHYCRYVLWFKHCTIIESKVTDLITGTLTEKQSQATILLSLSYTVCL